ncbi:MAG: hypothetical protein ACTSVL_06145 [Promethearchaeota archaeon]
MPKYNRIWKNKDITKEAQNIDDFIKIFENLTKILKKWKKEGVYLDPNSKINDDCATFYTTNQETANEENFNQEDSDELEEEIKFGDLFTILIYLKNAIIRKRFFTGINAYFGKKSSTNMKPLENFAIKSYQTKNYDFAFQFLEFTYKSYIYPSFPLIFSKFTIGFKKIIYFYHINEEIEENFLNMVKHGLHFKPPILFVGYDSILPKNPENKDQNIPIIQKYFNNFDLIYISTDDRGCMYRVLDKIVEIYFKLEGLSQTTSFYLKR